MLLIKKFIYLLVILCIKEILKTKCYANTNSDYLTPKTGKTCDSAYQHKLENTSTSAGCQNECQQKKLAHPDEQDIYPEKNCFQASWNPKTQECINCLVLNVENLNQLYYEIVPFNDDVKINPCLTSACLNHGRCEYNEETYETTCFCLPGYEGKYCNKKTNYCQQNGICGNGNCQLNGNSYICDCFPENVRFDSKNASSPCVIISKSTTSTAGFSQIAIPVVAVFVIAIIAGFIIKRRQNRSGIYITNETGDTDEENGDTVRGNEATVRGHVLTVGGTEDPQHQPLLRTGHHLGVTSTSSGSDQPATPTIVYDRSDSEAMRAHEPLTTETTGGPQEDNERTSGSVRRENSIGSGHTSRLSKSGSQDGSDSELSDEGHQGNRRTSGSGHQVNTQDSTESLHRPESTGSARSSRSSESGHSSMKSESDASPVHSQTGQLDEDQRRRQLHEDQREDRAQSLRSDDQLQTDAPITDTSGQTVSQGDQSQPATPTRTPSQPEQLHRDPSPPGHLQRVSGLPSPHLQRDVQSQTATLTRNPSPTEHLQRGGIAASTESVNDRQTSKSQIRKKRQDAMDNIRIFSMPVERMSHSSKGDHTLQPSVTRGVRSPVISYRKSTLYQTENAKKSAFEIKNPHIPQFHRDDGEDEYIISGDTMHITDNKTTRRNNRRHNTHSYLGEKNNLLQPNSKYFY